MKVVLINETHTPKMGYLGAMLPKYLTRLGLEVHVLATDLAAYHNLKEFKDGTPTFLDQQALEGGSIYRADGYTVHILNHKMIFGYPYMKGMAGKLRELRPDVVYSVLAIGWLPLQASILKFAFRYKLFTGSHTSALMFPMARKSSIGAAKRTALFLSRWMPGRIVSLFSEACYCPTSDCGEVARRFFGVQGAKVKIVHLGVDSDYFFPIQSASDEQRRKTLRAKLGFGEKEIVCIYTGKMAEMKNPLLLARAIQVLRAGGRNFKGLFIGDGVQRSEIEKYPDCGVLDFMQFNELGDYYRSADIAVWLTNESTSMLDAAACGVPIVVSDRIYQDHVTGNGRAYVMNDLDSLCATLCALEDEDTRRELGRAGARKMVSQFTWDLAARVRLRDFSRALAGAPDA